MKHNGEYILLSVSVILLLGQVSLAADPYIDKYGSAAGEVINNGFVFVDGRYLIPPYILERKGLALYINDSMIEPSGLYITKKALSAKTDYTLWAEEDRQRLLAKIKKVRGEIENDLRGDYYYLFFSKGRHISGSAHAAAYSLPKIIKDLRSTISTEEKIKKISRKNWHVNIGKQSVTDFVTKFTVTIDLDTRLGQLAEKLLHAKDFGTKSGAAIKSGFVFYNGRYLDSPYTVTRKGLGILIDGILVSGPIEWPRPISEEGSDPELPEWIVRNSGFEDVREYLVKKHRYLIAQYPEEEAIAKYVQNIRNLPCTKGVKFTGSTSRIEITTFSGEIWPMELSGAFQKRVKAVKYDKNSVLNRTEMQRKYYGDGLLGGYCFFIFESGEIAMPASKVAGHLPGIVEVLRSSSTNDKKFKKLQMLNISVSKESFSSLVTNFYASAQLELRLNELAKPK